MSEWNVPLPTSSGKNGKKDAQKARAEDFLFTNSHSHPPAKLHKRIYVEIWEIRELIKFTSRDRGRHAWDGRKNPESDELFPSPHFHHFDMTWRIFSIFVPRGNFAHLGCSPLPHSRPKAKSISLSGKSLGDRRHQSNFANFSLVSKKFRRIWQDEKKISLCLLMP